MMTSLEKGNGIDSLFCPYICHFGSWLSTEEEVNVVFHTVELFGSRQRKGRFQGLADVLTDPY